MRPRRWLPGASERAGPGDSWILTAVLLGVVFGAGLSIVAQRSSFFGGVTQAAAPCAACPLRLAGQAASETGPIGGVWHPEGRESLGNAELAALLKRIAINDEVLVAGMA